MTVQYRWLWLASAASAAHVLSGGVARAELALGPRLTPQGERERETAESAAPRRDVRAELPISAFAYGADGASKGAVGAQGFALGVVASGQKSTLGGGATVWGAPLERVTLVLDAQRNVWGNFSPSGAALVHLLGDRHQGWSLGGLGKFKIDGFASGPHKDEVESEVELGALVSLTESGFHLDFNAIAGRGLGDDGETDTEIRLRLGLDVGKLVWLGLDSQARLRVSGPKVLPNGRSWDFAAGPQVLFGSGSLFAILTAGPTTIGVFSPNVGFTSVLGIGGTT